MSFIQTHTLQPLEPFFFLVSSFCLPSSCSSVGGAGLCLVVQLSAVRDESDCGGQLLSGLVSRVSGQQVLVKEICVVGLLSVHTLAVSHGETVTAKQHDQVQEAEARIVFHPLVDLNGKNRNMLQVYFYYEYAAWVSAGALTSDDSRPGSPPKTFCKFV